MRGTAVVQNTNTFIKGWNRAKFLELREFTAGDKNFTSAKFDVGSNYPEEVILTNENDEPILNRCNEIIRVFGGKDLPEGTKAETIVGQLTRCFGKECSVLLVKKPSKKDPSKAYYKIYSSRPDWIKGVAAIGEEFTEEVTFGKPPVQKDETSTPFGTTEEDF